MTFGHSPKSPSFTKNRRGEVECRLGTRSGNSNGSGVEIISATGPLSTRPSVTGGFPPGFYDEMLSDVTVANMHSITSHVCTLQRNLTQKSSQRFAQDNFEAHWMTRSMSEREELILGGLVRTCEVSSSYESYRQCPHPGCVILKSMLDGRRTYLTMVVWHVLLAFYGESQEYGHNKVPRGDPEDMERFQKFLPPGMEVKSIIKDAEANRKRGERHCTSCGLPARITGVATLLACQRCKAIDRLVFYCSRFVLAVHIVLNLTGMCRECQTTDWKTGNPPLKSICGQKGAIAAAFLSAKSESPQLPDDEQAFPSPSPSYTRSPALLYQLKLLKENPQVDYVLVQPDQLPNEGIVLMDGTGFKLCMTRAICDHAPRAVFSMFHGSSWQLAMCLDLASQSSRSSFLKNLLISSPNFEPQSPPHILVSRWSS
ncbi:hypothetical protein C8R44DRAFT_868973 [Mycena epipterygia]|nr:hypothetical protein C8R44DRAFT_868973 [Mycena epipterygia]